MKNNKQQILILGGTGFIGINLVKYFSSFANYDVTATYNIKKKVKLQKVKWIKINLLNYKNLSSVFNKYDIIIQAAATTSGSKDIVNKPYLHVTDNAVMNSYILRSLEKINVKHFIFFSCSVMYPSSKKLLKEKDIDLNNKINEKYFGVAWTKLYIEKMCHFYSSICKTKFTIIRHSNVYGPNDKFDLLKSHVMGATITKVLKNNDQYIEVWGDGKEKRDLIYISDLLDFVSKVIKKQKNKIEIYNCGSAKGISIINLVKKVIEISKKNKLIRFNNDKPSIKSNVILNIDKAKKDLKWKPKVNYEKGISKTINWWRENFYEK